MEEVDITLYFEYIRERLKNPVIFFVKSLKLHSVCFIKNDEFLLTIVSSLQLVLRGDHYRKSFVSHHCLDGYHHDRTNRKSPIEISLFRLAKLLKGRYLSFQLQYQLIFCTWLLAFNAEIAAKLNGYHKYISTK